MIVTIGVIVFLTTLSIVLLWLWYGANERTQFNMREVERLKAEASRMSTEVYASITPLVWAWVEDTPQAATRRRVFLMSVFRNIQSALLLDDGMMGDQIEATPEPPRRMPTRPQVPPYLATAEDLAHVPALVQDIIVARDAVDAADNVLVENPTIVRPWDFVEVSERNYADLVENGPPPRPGDPGFEEWVQANRRPQ